MKKELLERALALSTANTLDEFRIEVLQIYIDQREKEELERRGGPIRYKMVWGRMKESEVEGFSYDGRTICIVKGSDFTYNETKSLTEGYKNLRDKLIKEGVVREASNGKYEFYREYTFESFSTAASVIRGVVLNGTKTFKKVTDF